MSKFRFPSRMALLLAAVTAALPQSDRQESLIRRLVAAAVERTNHVVRYDPGYLALAYPGGDVPEETGVCTDEIIRIYRALGIDLQKEVHEDMLAHFTEYPSRSLWKLERPDSNIDHRRVPNLMVFFRRKGEVLPLSNRSEDYRPGDLVTWNLGHGLTHIGIVVDRQALSARRYLIEHNIGAGPRIEDVLFEWKVTGHYRYFGPPRPASTPASPRPSRRSGASKQRENN